MPGPKNIVVLENVPTNSPELKTLPPSWTFQIEGSGRIFYVKGDPRTSSERSYAHPMHGPLPGRWIFQVYRQDDDEPWKTEYMDRATGKRSQTNPRQSRKEIEKQMFTTPRKDTIRGGLYKRKPGEDISLARREPIGTEICHDDYAIIKVLDAGDGTKGGMNGGVFVVCLKSNTSRFYVEKRFKGESFPHARSEIEMIYKLRQGSLMNYVNAFIDESSRVASLYVEFCDLGDLSDVIKVYSKHHLDNRYPNDTEPAMVPEHFVWHVFVGLCDGLAFLQGGRQFLKTAEDDMDADPNWTPILHRDIKPDNVLLRSRTTLGSDRYPYCVLSDFGLACCIDKDPYAGPGALGTSVYFAPELCYFPYPKTRQQMRYFPQDQRHTVKSDLWALGACVYNLAKLNYQGSNFFTHIDWASRSKYQDVYLGEEGSGWNTAKIGRITPLTVPGKYTMLLTEEVERATTLNPSERPDPINMMRHLKKALNHKVLKGLGPNEKLPEWALRKHEYHAIAEKEIAKLEGRN